MDVSTIVRFLYFSHDRLSCDIERATCSVGFCDVEYGNHMLFAVICSF